MKILFKCATQLICALFCILSSQLAASDQAPITLSSARPLSHIASQFLMAIYTEAFSRLNKPVEFVEYPARRSSLLSDLGEIDGELSRIGTYSAAHPHMVRVDEPHWKSGFVVFSNQASHSVSAWEEFLDNDWSIAYPAGVFGIENNLKSTGVAEGRVTIVKDSAAGLNMLRTNRVDVFLGVELTVTPLLNSSDFNEAEFFMIGVLDTFSGHAYLHEKHGELARQLSEILKQMKAEGVFDRLANETGYRSMLREN